MTGKREKSDLDRQQVDDLKHAFLAFAAEMDAMKSAMERASVDVLRDVPHQKSMAEGFRKLSVWVSGARAAALNLAVERVIPMATMKVADAGGEYSRTTDEKVQQLDHDLAEGQKIGTKKKPKTGGVPKTKPG